MTHGLMLKPRMVKPTSEERAPAPLSIRKAAAMIPPGKRGGAVGAVAASVALALLDFIGIAVLVPVLLLVLNQKQTFSYPAMQWLYDTAGFASFDAFVVAVCLAVLLVIIVKNALTLAISNSVNKYLLSLYSYFSTRMFDTYLSKGLLFIRNNHTSRLINNVNGVCLRFTEGILGQIFSIVTETILLMLVGAALLWYDPRLVLLAIAVFLPLAAIYSLVLRRRMNDNGRMENRLFVEQNKTLYETMRGYADIEINNAGEYVSRRFRTGLKELTEVRRRASLVRTATGRMGEFSLILGVVVMIMLGLSLGQSMDSLKISLGIFAVAAYKIIPSVNRITNSLVEYRRNAFAAQTISETLSPAAELPITDRNTSRLPFSKEIFMDKVSFSYDESEKEVLKDFSLTIRKGERIGIRGYSGVGKSTLFNILCGFFEPQTGRIFIDGTELTAENRRQWQNDLAYVSQDVFIPDITIAENIAFGIPKESIDASRLREAIHASSLAGFIDSLPLGADTVTGEAGCRLSGGQRQRIGIARALYKEASVLLFDEATSSLDSRTEREIVDAVKLLSERQRELTILIISHRERTLGFCDRIIEMERND